MSNKNLEGHAARCIQLLKEFNFISEQFQGRKHNTVDAFPLQPRGEVYTHCHKVEVNADVKQVRAIAPVAAAGWDPAALRREQPNDQNIGPILE
jgi:hypothetical protein